jgi:hypothetical protein
VKKIATGLALAAAFWGVSPAEAEGRPRYRYIGPRSFREPAPAYWRHYFGPTGTYGSSYYALANRPRVYLPPVYPPYGYGSAVGYPPPYYGDPYPVYRTPRPAYLDPYANPVLQESMLENQLRWGTDLPPRVTPLRNRVRLHPSTPEQQVKSIHAQAQGDVWMRRLKFLNAYERYKYAISAANDRPEPYFRLGYALAAVGSFDSAVKFIKQGLELDPQWPAHGERLEAIFGNDNRLAILSLTERVTGWVREDIRDPDRLFLVGVLLHFNGDDRASQFFEAAYRLAGGGDHLLAFLQPQPPENRDGAASPSRPGPPAGQFNGGAPPPEPVEPPLPLDAIPSAALSPPGSIRPGTIQPGMNQRDSNPRDLNQPGPALTPRPSNPTPSSPEPGNPANNNPAPALSPRRTLPQGPPPTVAPPAGAAPRGPVPPAPALPLPPLPAAADTAPGPESNVQAPTGGPLLTPSTDNSTAAKSP